MGQADYLVGLDLGTSNCALAFVDPAKGVGAPVIDFAVPQLQRAGESVQGRLLPSTIYLPGDHELAAELTRLPWGAAPDFIVGEFARWQGARIPGRLVSSAKSWLCHPGVDRSAPILPWGAPPEVKKLSPVEASARLLEHLKQAWNFAHPSAPLSEQEVILTVPASFDEAARALTVSAAQRAGLQKFTLLEEPQAAFYDFTARHRNDLAQTLSAIRLVLVVDVGGGTSDFTLVQVGTSDEGPVLRRIAVGEHLMLGGDNMDAALGRYVEERMLSGGKRLNSSQWNQLLQAARIAKETLLGNDTGRKTDGSTSPAKYHLSIVSEGSRLIGGTLSAQLTLAEAEQIILEGFFPRCGTQESPRPGTRGALHELGLPYAQEPAITRHLAAFLRAHAAGAWAALGKTAQTNHSLPRPDAILLNGGVFNSPAIAERLREVVSAWWPERGLIPFLEHQSLELAVARGAAYYGLVRRGLGRRIGGGAAHSLYVGLDQPGAANAQALCVIPRGQEEGETVEISGRTFELALGRPVRFPIYSSASDRFDASGAVVAVSDDMRPLPPIHTILRGAAGKTGNVPVHLRATLTEIGTLELSCVANETGERWRLEFEVRGTGDHELTTVTESIPESFSDARRWVEFCYGAKPRGSAAGTLPKPTAPKDIKQLWSSLEKTLGQREAWRLPVLRELWGALFAGAAKRRRSNEHERVYFQLLGFSLRPGFGYALDEWRCEQSVGLFKEGVEFHKEKANWKEFWILWRRLAGGLNAARQEEIWTFLKPHLAHRVPFAPGKQPAKSKGVQPEDLDEMIRLAASLEHLAASEKILLGDGIAARLRHSPPAGGPWTWALGRLAARVPIYGSVHNTLPPEKASEWIELLLNLKLRNSEGTLFALVQMARQTGDRARDIEEGLRREVQNVLRITKASPAWARLLSEVVPLDAADKARALGDTLPVGLVLT